MNKAISGCSSVSLRVGNNMPPNLRFDEVTENALFFSFERGLKEAGKVNAASWDLTESSPSPVSSSALS